MPELPEVETIRRDLDAALTGGKIKSVEILAPEIVTVSVAESDKKKFFKNTASSAVFFAKNLRGRKIQSVSRRGKLLIFNLSDNLSDRESGFNHLLIHLKMTGQLIYLEPGAKAAVAGGHSEEQGKKGKNFFLAPGLNNLPHKHTRAVISFVGGGQLFFNDLRKFGYLKLVSAPALKEILAVGYGPEPLSPEFSLATFRLALKGKCRKIKAVLLDQKVLAGLGNIYVDESLWAARLRPERIAASLSAVETKNLYQAINKIIKRAIKERGTTFNDYRDSRGQKGNFSRFLKVYGRSGEKCPACSRPISKIKVAGRGTHYCRYCQK